jgi:hypothetical protein
MAGGRWLHLVNHSLDHDFISVVDLLLDSVGDTMRRAVTAGHSILLLLSVVTVRIDFSIYRDMLELSSMPHASWY